MLVSAQNHNHSSDGAAVVLARTRSYSEPNGTRRPAQFANRQLLGSPFLLTRLESLHSVGARTADRQLFQGPAQRPGLFRSCRLAVGSERRNRLQVLLRCAMEYLTFGLRRRQRERMEEGGGFVMRDHRGEWVAWGCQGTPSPDPGDLGFQGDEWWKRLFSDLIMIVLDYAVIDAMQSVGKWMFSQWSRESNVTSQFAWPVRLPLKLGGWETRPHPQRLT